MRFVVTAMLGLVVGVVAGRLSPTSDLAELEAELAAARAGDDCAAQGLGRDLAVLMSSGLQGRSSQGTKSEPEVDLEALEQDLAEAKAEADAAREELKGQVRRDLADDQELQAARAALALRRTQARAALVEDADPDAAQLDAIDAAVEDMNASLEVLAEDLVGMFEEGGEPSRRDAMVFAAEALDTLITAEDRIWDSLDGDQRQAVEDGSVDPFSYVDESIVDVLALMGESP